MPPHDRGRAFVAGTTMSHTPALVSPHRRRAAWLAAAVCAAGALAAPLTARAQNAGEEPPAEGEPPPEDTGPKPLEPVQPGSWGVGGQEPEGKYAPHGKTGKLQEEEEEEEEANKVEGPDDQTTPGWAYFDAVVGVGDIRVVVQPGGPTSIFPTGTFIIGTGYRFDRMWGVGIRFGISSNKSDGPDEPGDPANRDRDAFKRVATGGLELSFVPYVRLAESLHLPVGLALTMPTQNGDMHADVDNLGDRGTAIVNQAAAAVRGWEDRALFSTKRFGVTPLVGVRYDKRPFEITAETKIEIMAKVGGNDPQPVGPSQSEVELRAVAVNWVLGGGFFYHIFDEGYLAPGARLWLAAGNMLEASTSQSYDGAQLVVEPGIKSSVPFDEGRSVGFDGQLGWIVPIPGMHLGGANDAQVWGFRMRAGLFF